MLKKNILKDEKGATAIIFAFALTIIIIMCSLTLDFGLVYVNASKVQNALDAAVLAAGRYLPVGENNKTAQQKMKDVIEEYLNKNEVVDISTLTIDFDTVSNNKYHSVSIHLDVETELHFAKIMGKDKIQVTKSAAAKIMPGIKIGDVVPLGVKKSNLDQHIANGILTNITLKYGGGSGDGGDYGAIDLDGVKGGGASDYQKWLTYGYTDELSIGEALYPVESGNMAGPTATAFNSRYYRCTHFPSQGGCNHQHFEPSCPRVVKVPVVVKYWDKYVKIVAFAAFVLDAPASEISGEVTGSFVNVILPGTPAESETVANDANYGIYSLKLSK